jgi:hypothetical protein
VFRTRSLLSQCITYPHGHNSRGLRGLQTPQNLRWGVANVLQPPEFHDIYYVWQHELRPISCQTSKTPNFLPFHRPTLGWGWIHMRLTADLRHTVCGWFHFSPSRWPVRSPPYHHGNPPCLTQSYVNEYPLTLTLPKTISEVISNDRFDDFIFVTWCHAHKERVFN